MQLSKIVIFEKCTKCQIGDWGFPQSIKSQKSVCGVPYKQAFLLFIFASGVPLANLARVKVVLSLRGGKALHFIIFLERESGHAR